MYSFKSSDSARISSLVCRQRSVEELRGSHSSISRNHAGNGALRATVTLQLDAAQWLDTSKYLMPAMSRCNTQVGLHVHMRG